MGGTLSNSADQRGTRKTCDIMTTQQLLMLMSKKVKDLQDTINNMERQPLADHVARPYLMSVLKNAEEELQHLKSSIGTHAEYHETQRRTGQDQHPRPDRENMHGSEKTVPKNKAPNHQIVELTSVNTELRQQVEQLTGQNGTNTMIDDLSRLNQKYKIECVKLQSELERSRAEKKELCLRLSKLTGDKLTADNPNIADLSDPYRPTKLVELMSGLYDDEWTEAFIALLPSKEDDRKVVKILLDTFLDVFSFCKAKSTSLVSLAEKSAKELFQDFDSTGDEKDRMTRIKSATLLRPNGKDNVDIGREQSFKGWSVVFMDWQNTETESELEKSGAYTNLPDVWTKLDGELKKTRKNIGVALIPIVTKAYLKPRWSKSCVRALKPYIKKCVYVAWMMCIQTPPMSIAPLPRHGDKFDTSLYNPYNKRGESVDFVVWPAVVLKEPQSETEKLTVMAKGVVQGNAV